MSVSTPRDGRNRTYLPGILAHLQLPKLTSLRVQVFQGVVPAHPFFPFSALHNHLPNFIELPELQVDINVRSGEVAFRSASQAIIEYSAEYLADYKSVERENWRGLPLRSVRRLTVNMVSRPSFAGLRWFFDLLEDLKCLEHLELRGVCNFAVDWPGSKIKQEADYLHIRTLTVRCKECGRPETLELKKLADAAAIAMTLIFTPDPGSRVVTGASSLG